MTQDVTSEGLIGYAAEIGYEVTARQLERWRAADILPRGRQKGRGRGPGSEWLYPPEARSALRLFLELRIRLERLEETAVRMWLADYDIPMPTLRKYLISSVAGLYGRFRRKALALGGAQGLGELIVDTAIRQPRYRKIFKAANMDSITRDRIQGAGEALGTAILAPGAPFPTNAAADLEAMLSLDEGEDALVRRLNGDAKSELMTVLSEIGGMEIALTVATDSDLQQSREMLRAIQRIVALAEALPAGHPARALLLRMNALENNAYSLGCTLLAVKRARTAGVDDLLAATSLIMQGLT